MTFPPEAAADEVLSYWRHVEAHTASAREVISSLVALLKGQDNPMSPSTTPDISLADALRASSDLGHGSHYAATMSSLYFEWHGQASAEQPPLLLIHGGGSTIESNWGRLIPALADSRRILAVELQGHGRTPTGDRPASFEGSADDVAALLAEVAAGPVDVLGFSNGGQVAMQLAIRHPSAVHRLVVASAPFRRDGMVDGFWEGLAAAEYADLPQPYRDADLAVSGDPEHAERMFHLDRDLMLTGFTDWPDTMVGSITAPTLVVAADQDVIRAEHTLLLAGLIPRARLLIVPGNHGSYLGELAAATDDLELRRTLPFITDFLD